MIPKISFLVIPVTDIDVAITSKSTEDLLRAISYVLILSLVRENWLNLYIVTIYIALNLIVAIVSLVMQVRSKF